MREGIRSFYMPLFALILLNLIVRTQRWYMMPSYVTGDTTTLIWMAESILAHGKAMWLLHPASAAGFADYSYPTGVPFLLAITSIITGLTRVDLLFPVSLVYIFIAIFAGYCLGYAFSGNRTIAFFTAFAISLSSEFVSYTSESGSSSARILLIIFLSLVIYLLLKLELSGDLRYIPTILIITSVALISHRASLSLIVVFIAYTLARLVTMMVPLISEKSRHFLIKNFKFLYIISFFCLYLLTFTPYYPLQEHLKLLQKGLFVSGTSPVAMTLNMIVDYSATINPVVMLFSLVGVLAMLKSDRIAARNLFLLFMLLGFTPGLAFSYYASEIITPMIALFFGCGVYEVALRSEWLSRWRSAALSAVFVLAVAALLIYITPIKSALFYGQSMYEEWPHVRETSKYIETEHLEGIWAETHFIARDYMLYSGKPVYPFFGPEYPVYHAEAFKSADFKLLFSPSKLGHGNNIWSMNTEPRFNTDTKYRIVYGGKPSGCAGIVYDNGVERIISEGSCPRIIGGLD